MNNTFKDYFTVSVSNDKTFQEVKNLSTYTKEDFTNKFIPKFENSYQMFSDDEFSQYGQIGIGTNHKVRGGFVIDCDATLSAEYIYEVCKRYFVEPSAILTTPKNHTQTFFFFEKDIVVYRGYVPTKKHNLYIGHLHKLNKWLGIGDENYTGYWCKNPFSDKWTCNYNTCKTYPFEALCFMIDELPETIPHEPRFTETTKCDVVYLTDLALGLETKENNFRDDEGNIHSIKLIEKYNTNPETNGIEYVDIEKISEDIEIIEEVEKKFAKINERRGKFKKDSENRHSFLFRVMLANRHYPIEYIKDLVRTYNQMFDNPLTEAELNKEVLNETTLTKTLHRYDDWRRNIKEMENDYIISVLEHNNGNVEDSVFEIISGQKSLHTALRLVKEYFPEYNCTELQKKYNKEYLGKYKGKYDNTNYVKVNKIKCKVRKWLKKNGNNKEYPKKWSREEIELADSLKSKI